MPLHGCTITVTAADTAGRWMVPRAASGAMARPRRRAEDSGTSGKEYVMSAEALQLDRHEEILSASETGRDIARPRGTST